MFLSATAFLFSMATTWNFVKLLAAKNPLIEAHFVALWQLLGGRLVYCFLLATGIAFRCCASSAREERCAQA